MIKDYKPSEIEERTDYYLLFYFEYGGGLAFPCDKNGKVDVDKLEPPAQRNYANAMAHPEKYPVAWNELETRTHRYRNPASGICHCGERIELYNQYLGACECPNCGQWWNLFGQELNPVETWRNGDDW